MPAWLISAAVCLALLGSAVAPASAQSFVYDVGVDLPEYVVLWYWDQITIDITAAELTRHFFGQAAVDAGTQSTLAGSVGGGLSLDAGIDNVVDDGPTNDPDDRWWLSVPDAWALESVSASITKGS